MKFPKVSLLSPHRTKTKFQRTNFYPTNFSKVDNFLMRSAQPSKEEIICLKEKEFLTDIVNLSNNSPPLILQQEEQTAKELGVNLFKIPSVTDFPTQKNIELFLQKTIEKKQNPASKMLVHCNAGVDRTGTYVVFYQLFNKLKSFDEAIAEMIQRGHWPEVHKGLLDRIKVIAKNMKLI